MSSGALANQTVTRENNGVFSEAYVEIDADGTATWECPETGGAIVRLEGPDNCSSVMRWDPAEENAFACPWHQMASGIMLLGTTGQTRVVMPVKDAPEEIAMTLQMALRALSCR